MSVATQSSPVATLVPGVSRTLVMGVVNVTPDSFSDGGRFLDPEAGVFYDTAIRLLC